MSRCRPTELPKGITRATHGEREAYGSRDALDVFLTTLRAPEGSSLSQDQFGDLRREAFEQYDEACKDWSCGKGVEITFNRVRYFEPADAAARVSANWATPKCKEHGIVPEQVVRKSSGQSLIWGSL